MTSKRAAGKTNSPLYISRRFKTCLATFFPSFISSGFFSSARLSSTWTLGRLSSRLSLCIGIFRSWACRACRAWIYTFCDFLILATVVIAFSMTLLCILVMRMVRMRMLSMFVVVIMSMMRTIYCYSSAVYMMMSRVSTINTPWHWLPRSVVRRITSISPW